MFFRVASRKSDESLQVADKFKLVGLKKGLKNGIQGDVSEIPWTFSGYIRHALAESRF